MMRLLMVMGLVLVCCEGGFADEFLRPLPQYSMIRAITAQKYPLDDAVIMLKEQRFHLDSQTYQFGRYRMRAPTITETRILIVRVLTEAAVAYYGSPEFEYQPFRTTRDLAEAEGKARVLKEDGRVITMNSADIRRVVAIESKDGNPLLYRMILGIPNVSKGDVVQIEFSHTRPAFSTGRIFFHSDIFPVLKSVVTLTVPEGFKVYFRSIPDTAVGKPEEGEGRRWETTYTWTVRGLDPIRRESYARPFRDRAVLTSFVVERAEEVIGSSEDEWVVFLKELKMGLQTLEAVSDDKIKSLGFNDPPVRPTLSRADSLYTALRSRVAIVTSGAEMLLLEQTTNDIIGGQRSYPSTAAYAMYNILQQWNYQPSLVLISDRRRGDYQRAVPSLSWFNRLGVELRLGSVYRLYDFDAAMPFVQEYPWYLSDVPAIVFDDVAFRHVRLPSIAARKAIISERHLLAFDESGGLKEQVLLFYRGSFAQKRRVGWAERRPEQVAQEVERLLESRLLSEVDSCTVNDFLHEDEIAITASGIPGNGVQQVDSILTVSIENHVLWELRDEFGSKDRQCDVVFPEPFELRMDWVLQVPEGLRPLIPLGSRSVRGPAGSSATIMLHFENNTLLCRCRLSVGRCEFPRSQYEDLVQFFDAVMAETNKTLVFTRLDPEASTP